MRVFILIISLFFTLFSCQDDNKEAVKIAMIDINLAVERFDIAFAEAKPEDLPQLKMAYPFMFPKQFDDQFWIQKMNDTLQNQLSEETIKIFPDLKTETQEIKQLFKHLKYYFPNFKTPRVITSTSDVDYRNKVIVTDTIAILELDTFLGSDHFFYQGLQTYISANMTADQIVVDLANAYAEKMVLNSKRTNLLEEMIYSGKLLYIKDKIIPFKTDAQKIGYTQLQLDWVYANQEQIWQYFIDKELLYSTDSKLPNRFINPAPFSKFYLAEIDNESPGKVGQFVGWQIVKAYMDNNSVTLTELLNTPAQIVFNKSKYKPRQ
ncbi:gliding motility lipoprotein GldB [Olleya sp. UBA1516]|uniref:gliding motility lipoprotein GldB n=1 Tax=Olleya sp. UBA1516 TaxID=1947013 RepID=UPI0025FA5942|nr:gliding motility lipoprotein GldB [Olleya sp. UBA1516]|tara:strand:+ start:5403 stop:6365 length:963 start_codon:yes stop_codon:yes gene_type:complete